MKYILTITALFLLIGTSLQAQLTDPRFYFYPDNHLEWFTIESEHFLVHYQEGNSRTAQVISRSAEEIYHPITGLYDYEPDTKVSIVVKDREDFANGAAYFFDNKIDIWVPALDTPLRGTTSWIRNVITHEFTHIVQIQTGLKRSRRVPAIYVQWLSYEEVRRPDVLFGFPNGIATFPFSSVNIPAWMAEGTAQYMRSFLHYDHWDSHRDMILRTRAVEDEILSLTEMGTFGNKLSIEREVVYNHGYAFIRYLANRFGEKFIADLSRELGKKGVTNVDRAIEKVTGISGKQVHKDWKTELKQAYTQQLREVDPQPTTTIEGEGFFNFMPQILPNGKIAYLSNRGRHFSRVGLYIKDLESGVFVEELADMALAFGEHSQASGFQGHFCVYDAKPLLDEITAGYSFSPDGKKLAFGKIRLNKFGESYNDLHIRDLASRKTRRITSYERLSSPQWHPTEDRLVALQMKDGTMNLVSVDAQDGGITQLTNMADAQQFYTPMWSPGGQFIYVAYSDSLQRSIWRYNVKSEALLPILSDSKVDYRDPFPSADGHFLYYSANPDGIFNIYRLNLSTNETQKITNVVGSAFMPFEHEGNVYFSEYKWDGYKISVLKDSDWPTNAKVSSYQFPNVLKKPIPQANHPLNTFDDTDIDAMDTSVIPRTKPDSVGTIFDIETRGGDNTRETYKYRDTFTSFSWFPTLRFDNYSRINGANGDLLTAGRFGSLKDNIWRDFKPGVIMASREVRERLNIFGGFFLGAGSLNSNGLDDFFEIERLVDSDRDAFLIFEYVGLPFIKRHWSPTISVELYNLRRNVDDGLQIEDFESTASLPDTTFADIAFDIWEADIFLRSKLDRFSLLELGYAYSPYRIEVNDFFFREFRQVVPSTSDRYFISHQLSAAYHFRYAMPHKDDDVVPYGIRGFGKVAWQSARLLDSFEISDGTLQPVYDRTINTSFETDFRYATKLSFLPTPVGLRTRFFSYLNSPDDFFYLDYIGGLIGMRSYPFFALGGNITAFTQLSTYVPLWKNANRQLDRFTVQKVWARLFAEAGNGWNGALQTGNNIKTGLGAELRLSMNSYYLFPSRFFLSAAYGFNDVNVTLPDDFVTVNQSNQVEFGNELLFYFGLLFDFEL